jgi:hypothetical protein
MSSMLNEAVVHGFDAATAANRPADIDADIAAALISNHFAMLTSTTWGCSGPSPPTPSGAPGRPCSGWPPTPRATRLLGSSNGGPTGQPGTQRADVTVTGPAGSLLLTLTRRLALTDRAATDISVEGDIDLARHWLDNTAHASG